VKFIKHARVVLCVAVLLMLAVSAVNVRSGVCFAAGDNSSPPFADADKALQRAFVAVADAEAAGANVSGLLAELDMAGRNLTEAEFVYAENYPSEAVTMADQCTALANAVADEALSLKSAAVLNERITSWQAVVFSLVGVFVFLMALVSVWLLFRHSYRSRLLRSKPEVRA
jgi:hypothetical protein